MIEILKNYSIFIVFVGIGENDVKMRKGDLVL
jgi:hypothetical protein